ncbi:MAG: polyamine aminopropyltransferase [Ignisphaera sp.]|uniref:Polyamine aminopropyltransferase n=1 Tax=Ignisphaera aggregans TaxID=334771 RepID=A0A7J3JQD5_9CREN
MLGHVVVIQGIGKNSLMFTKIKQIYAVKKSNYQEIIIADLEDFGRCLILDGYIQSSEADEFIYHEFLVHPAMIVHPSPRKVLIIGGGEGAALREVLKHNTVEEAVMVDIDKDVVELSKEYLPMMHRNVFSNPKANVLITDGKKYIDETDKKFDIVILDLTDPYSSPIARDLYTAQFYRKVHSILTDDGVMVTQAGSSFFFREVYNEVRDAVKVVFPYILEYQVWIPSFGYACNFIIGSKKYNPMDLTPNKVDETLIKRNVKTVFFNGIRYQAVILMGIY